MNQTKALIIRWRIIFVTFLFFILSGHSSLWGQEAGFPLSLKAAVDSALNNNPQIKQYRERVKQKEYLIKAARGNYFPSLNASGGYTYLSKNPEVNMGQIKSSLDKNIQQYGKAIAKSGALTPEALSMLTGIIQGLGQLPAYNIRIDKKTFPNFNITAVQPIYTGGKITAGLGYAKADAENARQLLQQIRNTVTREIIKNYYGVVLLKEVIITRKNVLSGMQKHESQAEKAFKIGMISTEELLRAKVAVANAERSLSDDQNRLSLAQLALITNMGMTQDAGFVCISSLKFIAFPIKLANLQDEALLHQPIFKMIDQKEEMVKQKQAVDLSAFLPQVTAWGEFSAFQDQYPVIMPPVMVGIQAKINLFNGLKKVNEMKATNHLKRQIAYARQYAQDRVNLWVNQSYRKAQNEQERYIKMQPTLALSAENLKITEKRFQEGLSKSIDVIDARLLDEKIQLERLQTLYDYYMALSEVYLSTGQPGKAVRILNR